MLGARRLFQPLEAALTFVGEATLLLSGSIGRFGRRRGEMAETVQQMAFIGIASVPIVALTGFFSGAVLSLYLSGFLLKYGAGSFVGATVAISVTREIGPVLAGVMVAARCGSAMAAQIATMKVTEQIDALKMLSVDPLDYLVVPRLIAGITMLPVLTLVCVYAGVGGGWLVALSRGIATDTFVHSVRQFVAPWDIWGGLLKGPVFGLLVGLVACQQGLRTSQGAVGVGRATTQTVVVSIVLIYMANFFLAQLFFG